MRGTATLRARALATAEADKQEAADSSRFRGFGIDEISAAGTAAGKAIGQSLNGPPPRSTITDMEVCQGCMALMEVVVRATTREASVRDIMFAIHSACNDQPDIYSEACMHATHYDANLAVLRQQNDDVDQLCKLGGMCL